MFRGCGRMESMGCPNSWTEMWGQGHLVIIMGQDALRRKERGDHGVCFRTLLPDTG